MKKKKKLERRYFFKTKRKEFVYRQNSLKFYEWFPNSLLIFFFCHDHRPYSTVKMKIVNHKRFQPDLHKLVRTPLYVEVPKREEYKCWGKIKSKICLFFMFLDNNSHKECRVVNGTTWDHLQSNCNSHHLPLCARAHYSRLFYVSFLYMRLDTF